MGAGPEQEDYPLQVFVDVQRQVPQTLAQQLPPSAVTGSRSFCHSGRETYRRTRWPSLQDTCRPDVSPRSVEREAPSHRLSRVAGYLQTVACITCQSDDRSAVGCYLFCPVLIRVPSCCIPLMCRVACFCSQCFAFRL